MYKSASNAAHGARDGPSLGVTITTIILVVVAVGLASAAVLWGTYAAEKGVVSRISRTTTEGFSSSSTPDANGYDESTAPPMKPYAGFTSTPFRFGVALLPPDTTQEEHQFRLADDAKLMALRPYQRELDGVNEKHEYTLEIPDGRFEQLLESMMAKERQRASVEASITATAESKKQRKRGQPRWEDRVDASRHRGAGGVITDGWVFNPLHPARLPGEVRPMLRRHLEDTLNRAAQEKNVGVKGEDFEVTVMTVDRAETGVLVREEDDGGSRIFDRFRLSCRACFHRSGKSIGHCARFGADVDLERDVLVLTSARYLGVLPEHVAAKGTTASSMDTPDASALRIQVI